MEAVRILLANAHPVVRSSLRLLLEREPGFRIVGEAANGREAVVLADYTAPDIALLDFNLPQLNGIATAREISLRQPHPGIVFIGVFADRGYVAEAFKAGARGYVSGESAQLDLIPAVRALKRGGAFLSPAIGSALLEEYEKENSAQDAPRIGTLLRRLGLSEAVVDSITEGT